MKYRRVEHRTRARTLVLALVGLGVVTVALSWGWNTFVVDMLGLQAMRFKHAVALEVLLGSAAFSFATIWRLFSGRVS